MAIEDHIRIEAVNIDGAIKYAVLLEADGAEFTIGDRALGGLFFSKKEAADFAGLFVGCLKAAMPEEAGDGR